MITNRPRTYPLCHPNGSPPDATYNELHPSTQQPHSLTTPGATMSDVRTSSSSTLGLDHQGSLPYTCLVSPTQTSQTHMAPHATSPTVYGDPFQATSTAPSYAGDTLGRPSMPTSWLHSPIANMRPQPSPFDANNSSLYSKRLSLGSPIFPPGSHGHPRHQSANDIMPSLPSSYTPYPPVISPPPPIVASKNDDSQQAHLRFNIVLQASTAVTQKTEETSITYLNRGQIYAATLADRQSQDGRISSSFVIMFHDPSHRKVALNYWKFWLGQQKNPQQARAIDLDQKQSTGIINVQYPSFDRITFDWNGRQGAKIYIRFNCLSTDFSRIKGVKGIPLRAHIENAVSCPAGTRPTHFPRPLAGTFAPTSPNEDVGKNLPLLRYTEKCYCKIKLFRDKGAERKNKDDLKQIGKHFEKMLYGMDSDPSRHPAWLVYNQPQPYSAFNEVPSTPTLGALESELPEMNDVVAEKHHNRVMTAPVATLSRLDSHPLTGHELMHAPTLVSPPVAPSSSAYGSESTPTYALPFTPPGQYPARPSPSPPGFAHTSQPITSHAALIPPTTAPSHLNDLYQSDAHAWPPADPSGKRPHHTMNDTLEPNITKRRHSSALSLFVDISTTQPSSRLHSPSTPSPTGSSKRYQRIDLVRPTVQELVAKLCSTLSLHPGQVSDVVWRKACAKKRQDDMLILVEDDVILEQFPDNALMTVEWEIKANGTVRLLLQF